MSLPSTQSKDFGVADGAANAVHGGVVAFGVSSRALSSPAWQNSQKSLRISLPQAQLQIREAATAQRCVRVACYT